MNQLTKLINILALCTIVGLSCWIGYLLSANESKAHTIEYYEQKDTMFNRLLEVDRLQDSIINKMPPATWELDKNGIYNLNYN